MAPLPRVSKPHRGFQRKLIKAKTYRLAPPGATDWGDVVHAFLTRWGASRLYALQKTGTAPDALPWGELADILEAEVYRRQGAHVKPYKDENGVRTGTAMTPENLTRTARNAARYLEANYDVSFVTRVREFARWVGARGGRPRSFALEALAALDGLTHAEAAEALGVSRETVKRRRAELRENKKMDTSRATAGESVVQATLSDTVRDGLILTDSVIMEDGMPQSCSVCASDDVEKINRALIKTPNVSAVWRAIPTIAPEATFSESALRRHHRHTALTLTPHVEDGFTVSDALGLYVAAAEDAMTTRQGALARGNLSLLHRNALTTVAVADALLKNIPSADLDTVRQLQTGEQLVLAIGRATRKSPEVGAQIAAELDQLGEAKWAASLRAHALAASAAQTEMEHHR